MSASWKIGLDGNWSRAANWAGAVPDSNTATTIDALGSYTVTLSTAGAANVLTMNAAGATLLETATGSLSVVNQMNINAGTVDALAGASIQTGGWIVENGGTLLEAAGASLSVGGLLQIQSGLAELNAANTIAGGVDEIAGEVVATDSGALGTNQFQLQGGTFLADASITIANKLVMSGNEMTIAAAHGTVLDFDSAQPWYLNTQTIHFGAAGDDGTIVWNSGAGTGLGNQSFNVAIDAGTLQNGGDANFPFLFQTVTGHVSIAAGAAIDLAGLGNNANMVFRHLQGAGAIENSGALSTLRLLGDGFSGTIQDAIALTVSTGTVTLSGNNTYTGGTTVSANGVLQLGAGGTGGSVAGGIVLADATASVVYDHSGSFTDSNAISGFGSVTFEGGANYTINQASSYSGMTMVQGSTVTLGNGGAFGTGAMTLASSNVVATTDEAIGVGLLTMTGTDSFAAAHGKTLTNVIAGTNWVEDATMTGPVHLTFGGSGHDGTVVWNTGVMSTIKGSLSNTVEVKSGTLRGGDINFGFVLTYDSNVAVDAGATIDIATFNTKISNLTGTGTITGQAGSTVLLNGGNFGGAITGGLGAEVTHATLLTGTSTYTGGTTIDSGAALSLGNGGTGGTIAGAITDNGSLYIDHANKVTLANAIAGSGDLTQVGPGTTVINSAENYTGGTYVLGGQLWIGEADAIGPAGALGIEGGEFVATATMGIARTLFLTGNDTIAAAKGATLTMNTASPWTIEASAPESLTFGDSAHKGTVVWMSPTGSSVTGSYGHTVDIADGTLKAGDGSLSTLTMNADTTTVASGATLDMAGSSLTVNDLLGGGVVTDSGAATLHISGGDFTGALNGALLPDILGTVTLTGGGSYTGPITIEQAAQLNLADTAVRTVDFASYASALVVTEAAGKSETVNVSFNSGGDTVDGGDGNETFNLGATFSLSDRIDGGNGNDVVSLNGDYAGYTAIVLGTDTITDVETLVLAKGHDYGITTDDTTVAAGQTLTVDASALKSPNSLMFDGSAETDGHFRIIGGFSGDDLTGGALSDTFVYTAAGQSTSTHFDTIHGFDFASDSFDIPGAPGTITSIDAGVTAGLVNGSFDHDLAAAVSTHLAAHSAMLVTATGDTYGGQVFLVVDLNGTAGYQAGADLVIDLANATGTLTTSDFV